MKLSYYSIFPRYTLSIYENKGGGNREGKFILRAKEEEKRKRLISSFPS